MYDMTNGVTYIGQCDDKEISNEIHMQNVTQHNTEKLYNYVGGRGEYKKDINAILKFHKDAIFQFKTKTIHSNQIVAEIRDLENIIEVEDFAKKK